MNTRSVLSLMAAFAGALAVQQCTPAPDPCAVMGTGLGAPVATVTDRSVSIAWAVGADASGVTTSVTLTGPASVPAAVTTNPAVFNNLANGSWTATVTHSLAGCSAEVDYVTFKINSTDCTTWSTLALGDITVTLDPLKVGDCRHADIDWDPGTVTGETSYDVEIIGPQQTGEWSTTKPVHLIYLADGTYTVRVRYMYTGCDPIVKETTFDVGYGPLSFKCVVYPQLSKCMGCHNDGPATRGNFALKAGGPAAAYLELTAEAPARDYSTCLGVAQPAARVTPGNELTSVFYARISGPSCDPATGTMQYANNVVPYITPEAVLLVKDWILAGALND